MPRSDTAPTIWLWLYGRFDPAWTIPEVDAYQLFVTRAMAMGWLTDAIRVDQIGLWGMNDAGLGTQRTSPDGVDDLAAWFQVVDTSPQLPVLPVVPLLACATSVARRIGSLDLTRVQLLVSPTTAARSGNAGRMHLLSTADWFDAAAPERRCLISAEIDLGSVPITEAAGDRLVAAIRGGAGPFRLDSWHIEATPRGPLPGVLDAVWSGPPCHRLVLAGSLAEWTTEAIGWLAALLLEACLGTDLSASALLSIARR